MLNKKNLGLLIAWIIIGILAIVGIVYFFIGRPAPSLIPVDELQLTVMQEKGYQACLEKAEKALRRDPNNEEIWHWKGVCEFELDLFDQARQSFAKLLSLNPNHPAGQTYSKILNDPNVIVIPAVVEKDRTLVESKIDFTLDPGVFTFVKTIPGGTSSNGLEFVSAIYSTEKTFEETINYLKEELKRQNLSFNLEGASSDYRLVFKVNSRLTKTFYSFFVFQTVPVSIMINVSTQK